MNLNPEIFRIDNLSIFIGIFVSLFAILTVVYSFGFMRGRRKLASYYLYIILTLIASLGAVFSNNLILFIAFWGFLGFLLYLLIGFGDKKNTSYTAKKAMIIVGGTDALMLLGLALVFWVSGSLQMDKINLSFTSTPVVWAYLCLAAGAFAKAGAMPFHTWVPDVAEDAPTPVTAYLPASLDKLLGIYLLVRISLEMFTMNNAMNVMLMTVGSFTIIAAVMMALVQSDFKRLLGYLAVSSAGYMVLGLGTGNSVSIAGGLFYMLNSAICMSCLFMACGSVEKNIGTTDLKMLGGFAKFMPITFITFLIASFAISGVPPFNGFASKWMVYQGIIDISKSGGKLWVVWLVAAMIGSALTLASFMKLIHAIFLGQPSSAIRNPQSAIKEVRPTMWVPSVVLALLCIVFGVFAYSIPLRLFIFPGLEEQVVFPGIWNSGLATVLILAGIVVGIIIYLLGTAGKTRQTTSFIGGENLKKFPEMRISGVEFYRTVQDIGVLRFIYKLARKKYFDIYEVGKNMTFGINRILSYLHNGVLPTYLAWCLLGMGIVFYILILR